MQYSKVSAASSQVFWGGTSPPTSRRSKAMKGEGTSPPEPVDNVITKNDDMMEEAIADQDNKDTAGNDGSFHSFDADVEAI